MYIKGLSCSIVSRIQISNTLLLLLLACGKAFHCCARAVHGRSAVRCYGGTLYWVSADVPRPRSGWSMRQALALLLVPDIPLTDKKQ